MVDLEQYRADSLDNWNRVATNWEEERDFLWSTTGPVGDA